MQRLKHEYIGSNMEILASRNKTLVGLKGRIIDETKNTFKIKTNQKIRTILKNGTRFKINNQTIDGNQILKRPENRIKIKNAGKN